MVTITFKNGLSIEAEQNGSCYILDEKPTFPEDLSEVTITADETTTVIKNARLIEPYAIDDRYWFSFIEISKQELFEENMQANIDYIAMMADIDLEEV